MNKNILILSTLLILSCNTVLPIRTTHVNAAVSTELAIDDKADSIKAAKPKMDTDIILIKQATEIVVGDDYTFAANVDEVKGQLLWSVSNRNVATINEITGKLTTKKAGSIVVTAKAGELVKKIKVKVIESTEAKNFRYSIQNNQVTIEKMINSSIKKVVVPARIEGKPVTKILTHSFSRVNANTVIIPGSIQLVENNSFTHCRYLTTIKFLEGARGIQKNFLGSNVPVKVLWIPGSQKNVNSTGCLSLQVVYLGEGVTKINVSAFSEQKNLMSIHLPSTLITISTESFFQCQSLEKIVLPTGIKLIGDEAFASSGLKEVAISGSNIELGTRVFSDCKSLKKAVIKNGIREITAGMFAGCTSLEELELADSVEKVATGFIYGANLKHIKMNYIESREMSDDAFRGTIYENMAIGAITNSNYEILNPYFKEQVSLWKSFLNTINENDSDVIKVKKAHDWTILNAEYDFDAYNESRSVYTGNRSYKDDMELAYSYKGFVKNKMVVCSGYTDVIHLLLDMMKINNMKLHSISMDHDWNLVQLDGKWYHLDATWDDATGSNINYKYFLINDKQMAIDHTWEDYLSVHFPKCKDIITNYQ